MDIASKVPSKSIASSSQEGFFQEGTLSKIVSTIAWLAISTISFYFAGLVVLGAFTFSSPWLFTITLAATISVGCVALFNAYMSATSSLPHSPNPSRSRPPHFPEREETQTTTSRTRRGQASNHATQEQEPKSEKSNLSKSTHIRAATGSRANRTGTSYQKTSESRSVISTWIYDKNGTTQSCSGEVRGYADVIQKAKKCFLDDPTFYEITSELHNVPGDGNCGYYSLAAILLKNAVDDPVFRETIKARIRNTFIFGNDIRLFGKIETAQDLQRLKGKILDLFELTGKETQSMSNILTYENATLFNQYFRALIIADFYALPEINQHTLTLDNHDRKEDPYSLLTNAAVNKHYTEPPMILSLAELLGVRLKVINITGDPRYSTLIDVSDVIDNPFENPIGYLVFVTGHFLAAFPRKAG